MFEGDAPTDVMLLLRGRVKVVGTSVDGMDALLGLRGPGELVGEFAAFDTDRRSATVVAIDQVEVRAVPVARFRKFFRDFPAAAAAAAAAFIGRIREADQMRITYRGADSRSRLAGLIVELADRYGAVQVGEAGRSVDLPLTQDDLGGAIGASRESVARAFAAFRAAGLVRTGRRKIVVLNMAGLRAEATRRSGEG